MRLHVMLRLADLQPDDTIITEGKICERAAMRRMLKPGEFYLGDRNYGADHALFPELVEMGCGFVLRMAAEEAARQRRGCREKESLSRPGAMRSIRLAGASGARIAGSSRRHVPAAALPLGLGPLTDIRRSYSHRRNTRRAY